MFSISNNNLPIDFQDMFIVNNQIHSYNTRSSNFFHVPRNVQELNFVNFLSNTKFQRYLTHRTMKLRKAFRILHLPKTLNYI